MLEQQAWMHYNRALDIEWKQSRDEAAAPHEPSGYGEIAASLPERAEPLPGFDAGGYRDRLAGAWTGRIAGCLLGKPVEGWMRDDLKRLLSASGNFPMSRYILAGDFPDDVRKEQDKLRPGACWADRIGGCAPIDDDTNYTVLAMKLVKQYGRDFRPNDVLEAWLKWLPMLSTCTAERVAYANAAQGLLAPETAYRQNPYREWIGAQIRGDLFGYINPGRPRQAAEMAWRDASISHVKNGIYGEMMAAAMTAAAAVSRDALQVVRAGLAEIPAQSRLRRNAELVLSWRADGWTAAQAADEIHRLFDERDPHGWCHTIPNAMIVAMALLFGEGDFGRTICLAVQTAFDTDCNGATAGSILGMMLGRDAIPAEWPDRFGRRLATDIAGYPSADIDALTDETLSLLDA